jgi:hypothetical protein
MQHTGCILSVASAYKELSSLLYLLSLLSFFLFKFLFTGEATLEEETRGNRRSRTG